MHGKKPIISVIIASYTGSGLLARCLASVMREKGDKFELILVNDGSPLADMQEIIQIYLEDKRFTSIYLPNNVGAAKARNIGAAQSQGKYLFFLDNDTKISPGWSPQIPAFFEQHKKTGIAQVKLLRMHTKKFDSAGELLSPLGFLVERARGAHDQGQFDQSDLIFSGKSAGMIVRRDVFDTLNGFDEDFYIFWEDTDLCWRAWLLGREVRFFPSIAVEHAYLTHEKSADIYRINRVFYYGSRNMIQSTIKNRESFNLFTTAPIVTATWIILAVFFLLKWDFYRSSEIVKGIVWNSTHISQIMRKRAGIQQSRKLSDRKLFGLVGVKQPLYYYFGKARAYILQRAF